jgi:hypothetical protein
VEVVREDVKALTRDGEVVLHAWHVEMVAIAKAAVVEIFILAGWCRARVVLMDGCWWWKWCCAG